LAADLSKPVGVVTVEDQPRSSDRIQSGRLHPIIAVAAEIADMATTNFYQKNVHVKPMGAVHELRTSLMALAQGYEHNAQATQKPDPRARGIGQAYIRLIACRQ
jgi:hypothetical protein